MQFKSRRKNLGSKAYNPNSESNNSVGKVLDAAVIFMLFMLAGPVQAGESPEIAFKYHCMTCHGVSGVANSDRYPNLAGQNVAYLESRLKYFRAQEEPGNQMNAQAAPLSNEEITQLAKYFNGGS